MKWTYNLSYAENSNMEVEQVSLVASLLDVKVYWERHWKHQSLQMRLSVKDVEKMLV